MGETLIKKGGGIWPCDALATLAIIRLQEGANSIPAYGRGQIIQNKRF